MVERILCPKGSHYRLIMYVNAACLYNTAGVSHLHHFNVAIFNKFQRYLDKKGINISLEHDLTLHGKISFILNVN